MDIAMLDSPPRSRDPYGMTADSINKDHRPHEPLVAYAYRPGHLYLNITNRCTNACLFCALRQNRGWLGPLNLNLGGFEEIPLRVNPRAPLELRPVSSREEDPLISVEDILVSEPEPEEIIAELDGAIREHDLPVEEVVFCGSGEPLIRLETVLETSRILKARGWKVRVNTNGQAFLIHGTDTVNRSVELKEWKECIDAVSISLNAQDAETYLRLCRPAAGIEAFHAVLSFSEQCAGVFRDVCLSVVMPGPEASKKHGVLIDTEACRMIARKMGARFRLR